MKKMTIREFVTKFQAGEFDTADLKTQIMAGWEDWFCKNEALAAKTKRLGKIVVTIAESKKFDQDKTYVSFKNHCPMPGPLYDSFSIVEIDGDQDVLFRVTPKSGHTGKAEIERVKGVSEEVYSGDLRGLKAWFLTPYPLSTTSAEKTGLIFNSILWIAGNDNPAEKDVNRIASSISVCLVADVFGVSPIEVSKLVLLTRNKISQRS